MRIKEAEHKYVSEVLASEFRTSKLTGMTTRFEQAFVKKFGTKFGVSHINGTATMHSALAAAGVGPGDEVIVPPLTMASTSLVVLHQNAIPVFADIDPDTFTLDPESIRKSITEKTKAIIPVSVYGLSPDYDSIMEIAKHNNLYVIEDNAECFLGYYKDRLVGTLGHMASFSFQASKHMTSGEGGIVITDDESLADKMRAFSIVGYDIVSAKAGKITKDVLQNPNYARHTSFGYKYKMPDLCAAVALGQLEQLDMLVESRKSNAKKFLEIVKDCSWLKPQKEPDGYVNSYYTLAMLLDLDSVDFTWHQFRKQFLDFGGDGFYAAWLPTYREPMWKTQDHRVLDVINRFGNHQKFLDYYIEHCPNEENIQPRIIQLKTNYLDPARCQQQVEIFAKTIRRFS